ncbi:hypothetical protein ARALYDRAFT_486851 [Arabidopsis lyrata subsp. lyrata]|uniref:DUF4378 domain-containing protein n=1 Tax=Arabidopsis lyrata subsp. lyrata TaxID=81972 RepID=D7LTR0_ARALL|nr:uncharacterized protein LOC9312790 [Arabidopsis lyrata subsp. lyrata]EFH52981.1 hypothetical protein ARALYDRAFT_486851 [Arabidopsis lyrata subsp. lyrata]|eukprot:XP_020880302.1 uncharacterized protein LOC9312790 [Arabidopsis lyrata subsp. lyrata]
MEKVKEQDLEKQIGGCMAGFFNIFDRPNLLSPNKRLSSSPSAESESASGRSSPLNSRRNQQSVYSTPELRSPPSDSLNLTTLAAVTEDFKQQRSSSSRSSSSPWRFSKEAPRLSLDSRAVVDAKGCLKPRQIRPDADENLRGSPSVIARLMGLEPLPLQRSASESRVSRDYLFDFQDDKGAEDPAAFMKPARAPPLVVRRKSFFDSPEPRQCGRDLERVSKMSGFDDAPPTDLETLKQLLEALRLKGLLHSSHKHESRNLVFDHHQSPIKPIRSGLVRRDRGTRGRGRNSPSVNRRPRPTLKEQRRVAPLPWRRPEPLQWRIEDQSSSTLAEETNSDVQKWKVDVYNRQGKTLLERCDKLLHSIAEMAAAAEAGESQPSPVSVLDASIYHEDSSPSPVMKRTLDFSAESEDESWGGSILSSSDTEYVYISDILRASDCLSQESDIFSFLEKQQYLKGKCTSIAAAQERRLIFDAVQEIVARGRSLPPWRMVAEADKMQVIWSEFQKIREKKSSTDEEEDLVGYVCRVLGRDLSEDRWRDCHVEMSEAVLDIERLVFKDLIGETIRHLAALNRSDSLRRRLLF